jgi:hypothetical protein
MEVAWKICMANVAKVTAIQTITINDFIIMNIIKV